VTRENGQLSFKSSDVSLSCNLESLPNASDAEFKETVCIETIGMYSCTHAFLHHLSISFLIGSESQTAETATLITSFFSDGSLEWISLHTKTEWTHCTFPEKNCSTCTTCVGMFSALIYKSTQTVLHNWF
jgi:hypothetical protein